MSNLFRMIIGKAEMGRGDFKEDWYLWESNYLMTGHYSFFRQMKIHLLKQKSGSVSNGKELQEKFRV